MCAVVVQIRLQSFYVDLGRIGTGHARSTVVFLGIVAGDYYLTMRFILTRLSRNSYTHTSVNNYSVKYCSTDDW